MATATLVLQYPDLQTGKVRLLAASRDQRVLNMFRACVLEEARLNALGCDDEVLLIEYQEELRKLEKLLNVLIPEKEGPNAG